MADVNDWNQKIIEEFRANGGRVGGQFEGAPMILVHHTGARSGTERVNPLVYRPVGEAFAVFASAAGAARDPDWYRNLVAHPDTTVEVGGATVAVRARVLTGEERSRVWEAQKAGNPGFAEYETKAAPREIPVVLLEPTA